MSVNRAQLVEKVQKELGGDTSKAGADRALTAVIDSIKVSVKKSKSVQLIGFGTFKVVNRKARTGVNPKTGEKIKIAASKSVKFSPGKDFKKGL
ncbi:MAG: HU family DNA-binding protein [Verrucomicrobiales bacterium]|jgi:nucleoid DNA-binding protein|nr:HU family DNA-binding protein [Verrucomicrobiales bacterium]MDR1303739.1 HU family DNA-binding protein [Verrucomicrobiales bacterium]